MPEKRHLVAADGRFHRKKVSVDRDVLDLARERVRDCFRLFDTCVVSFSGGKDSTVVLNLTIEAAKEIGRGKIRAIFLDEEAISYETEQYVRRVNQGGSVDLEWYCVPVEHRNACSRRHPFWYPWAPEDEHLWVRPMPPEGITFDRLEGFPINPGERQSFPNLIGYLYPADKYGRVGMLMGIRAQESLTRLGAILKPTTDSRPWIRKWEEGYRNQGNIYKCYPIYDWRTEDVWTAPAEFGWDYNKSYDIMDKAGIPPHQQRVAPPYGEEPMQHLWMYAQCFPDIWDKMSRRVPGAATGARYSRSYLYGYGALPEKPAGISWHDYIRGWILKHPKNVQAHIARRIKMWLNTHYSTTRDPIAVNTPHPQTGVCWNFIMMLAMRGDFKERKQPRRNDLRNQKSLEARREKYAAEIARMRSQGEL